MSHQDVSRRTLLKGGGAALAGLTVQRVAGPAHAFPSHPEQENQSPGMTTSLTRRNHWDGPAT